MSEGNDRGVLYLMAGGAPRAKRIGELVGLLQADGWTVCVVATPQGLKFIDREALEEQTGFVVRHEYKQPDAEDVLPPPDAMVICPATFNTVNKLAAGISDTLALGLFNEAFGLGIPLVVAPALNSAQEQHPAWSQSVATLRNAGVTVLYGEGVYVPTAPRSGGRPYDWSTIIDALRAQEPT